MQSQETEQSTNTQVETLPLYDAQAEQRIPFLLETETGLVQVYFILGPQADKVLIEHERRLNLRVKKAELSETGGLHGVMAKSEKVAASAELFDTVAIRAEGFGDSDDDLPDDWKTRIDPADKADVIDQAYLATDVLKPMVAVLGTRVSWDYRSANKTHTLRALFNGYQLELKHTLGKASATQIDEFKSIMGQAYQVQGAMLMQGEALIAPRYTRLGKLYTQLHQAHENYNGWPRFIIKLMP